MHSLLKIVLVVVLDLVLDKEPSEYDDENEDEGKRRVRAHGLQSLQRSCGSFIDRVPRPGAFLHSFRGPGSCLHCDLPGPFAKGDNPLAVCDRLPPLHKGEFWWKLLHNLLTSRSKCSVNSTDRLGRSPTT